MSGQAALPKKLVAREIHRWEPLTLQRNEFRILKLLGIHHEQGEQIVKASIRNVSGIGHPPYLALSYCWGTLGSTMKILINGRVFFITENLHKALLVLIARGVTNLWVDALCIDQENPDEKAAQVQRMVTIFQEADSVLLWLGSLSPSADRIICQLKSLKLSTPQQNFWGRVFFDDHTAPPGNFNDAFLELLECDYWYRTWIVQEVAVAKHITIFSETEYVDGAVFESLFSKAHWDHVRPSASRRWSTLSFDAFEHMVKIWNIRYFFRKRRPMHLLELLCDVRYGTTSLPLDRIYAVYGLAFDQRAFVAEPDYTLQPSQLCLYMTRHFIEVTGSLDIVLLGVSLDKEDLPSWCCPFLEFNTEQFLLEEEKTVNYLNGKLNKHRCGDLGEIWNTTISGLPTIQRPRWRDQTLQVVGMRLGRATGLNQLLHTDTADSNSQLCTIFDSLTRLLMIHSHLYNDEDRSRLLMIHILEEAYTRYKARLSSSGTASDGDRGTRMPYDWSRLDKESFYQGFLWLEYARPGKESPETLLELGKFPEDVFHRMLKSGKKMARSRPTSAITTEEIQHASQIISQILDSGPLTFFLIDFEDVGLTTHHTIIPPWMEVWLLDQCSYPVLLEALQPGDYDGQVRYRLSKEVLIDKAVVNGRRCNVMNGEAWAAARKEDLQVIDIL